MELETSDQYKIRLLNKILLILREDIIKNDDRNNFIPNLKFVGILNKPQGIKGFKTADIGDPVFEDESKGRYIIILESLDGKVSAEIPYYKETLGKCIDFKDNF